MRMRPTLQPNTLDAPSICSTHTNAKSTSGVSICFDLSSSLSLGLSSDMVHSMIKSIKTYVFIVGREWYWISNSLSFKVHFIIRLEVSGQYRIIFNGWSVKTTIGYAGSTIEVIVMIWSEHRSSFLLLDIVFQHYEAPCWYNKLAVKFDFHLFGQIPN